MDYYWSVARTLMSECMRARSFGYCICSPGSNDEHRANEWSSSHIFPERNCVCDRERHRIASESLIFCYNVIMTLSDDDGGMRSYSYPDRIYIVPVCYVMFMCDVCAWAEPFQCCCDNASLPINSSFDLLVSRQYYVSSWTTRARPDRARPYSFNFLFNYILYCFSFGRACVAFKVFLLWESIYLDGDVFDVQFSWLSGLAAGFSVILLAIYWFSNGKLWN